MRAFVIRPFGIKSDLAGNLIDFEKVERELIGPALSQLGITGRTTEEITEAGNIREDMFQLLATADLVIADISVHNANVFYELGVRHALRDKRTFLIRCEADQFPFDLQTDRYLVYKRDSPAATVDVLAEALRQTRDAERRDSPIFLMLPELCPTDPARFLVVPPDFGEDVERAATAECVGDLALFASEVQGLPWEREGLRVLGRVQRRIMDYDGAIATWERLRKFDSEDTEANLQLGTLYARLEKPVESNFALRRVLKRSHLDQKDRAEALSLQARNLKDQWRQEWSTASEEERRSRALRSGFLKKCFECYEKAYLEDLNEYYGGLNAAAMLTVLVHLAAALPDVWTSLFDLPDEAQFELGKLRRRLDQLFRSVELTLHARSVRPTHEGTYDIWLDISRADLACLTAQNPARVESEYAKAFTSSGVGECFERNAVGQQLALYEQLGVLEDNVRAALRIVQSRGIGTAEPLKLSRVLLFTGHRIDDPGRTDPRFPPDREQAARAAIREAIVREVEAAAGQIVGLAGGASGGDILFHELCDELHVPTEMYLTLPPVDYIAASVASAGSDWVERFHKLRAGRPERVLSNSKELPRWLRCKQEYDVWQRANLWMLHNSLVNGPENITLIALWNGKIGDGPGGTEDMVNQARCRGARVVILDTTDIFNL